MIKFQALEMQVCIDNQQERRILVKFPVIENIGRIKFNPAPGRAAKNRDIIKPCIESSNQKILLF